MNGISREGRETWRDSKSLECLIFIHIDGSTAGSRGQPRSAPAGLSEDAAWTWLEAYDRAAKEKVDRAQGV